MLFATTFLVLAGIAQAALIKLPPPPADKTTPVQTRLSYNAPGNIALAWNTYEKMSKPCVHYGTNSSHLNQMACSTTSITYPTSRTWANLVILENLASATRYYYKIVSTNSTMDFFLTMRAPGDMTPFTMVTLADLGVYGMDGYTTMKRSDIPMVQPALNHTTIGRLAQMVDSYEFIAHPGDFAYADDWMDVSGNENNSINAYTAIIEDFYTQLAPITSRKPYMVSPGNHEADCTEDDFNPSKCPVGQTNFSDFRNRWFGMMPTAYSLPATAAAANSTAAAARTKAQKLAVPPFWYSFDHGLVHVILLDTETDFPNAPDAPGGSYHLEAGPFGSSGQQLAFLEADLSSVDRTVTPWVVVGGHRPWYTNGKNAGCKPCQAAFEGVLYKYGVDLAFFGHVHNLQRFAPIFNNTVDPAGYHNPKAPMYTVIGGPGNIEGHSPITPSMPGNEFAYNSAFGFASLHFYNSTNMGVTFYESMTGAILDEAMLYKEHKEAYVVQ